MTLSESIDSATAPDRLDRPAIVRSLIRFMLLAWGFTWLAWLPLILQRNGMELPGGIRYVHYLGGLGPALAAFVVAWIERSIGTDRRLREELTRWRGARSYVIVGGVGPLVLFGLAAVVTSAVGEGWPEWSRFGASSDDAETNRSLYWLLTAVGFGWGEEIGWRGFALPRLQRSYSPLASAVFVSVIWSIWHLPAFFYNPGYMEMGAGGIAGWYFSMLTGSVILTWLFNGSHGSILVVALFHAMLDITINSPGPELLQSIMGAMITLAGVGVIIATRGRLATAERPPVI